MSGRVGGGCLHSPGIQSHLPRSIARRTWCGLHSPNSATFLQAGRRSGPPQAILAVAPGNQRNSGNSSIARRPPGGAGVHISRVRFSVESCFGAKNEQRQQLRHGAKCAHGVALCALGGSAEIPAGSGNQWKFRKFGEFPPQRGPCSPRGTTRRDLRGPPSRRHAVHAGTPIALGTTLRDRRRLSEGPPAPDLFPPGSTGPALRGDLGGSPNRIGLGGRSWVPGERRETAAKTPETSRWRRPARPSPCPASTTLCRSPAGLNASPHSAGTSEIRGHPAARSGGTLLMTTRRGSRPGPSSCRASWSCCRAGGRGRAWRRRRRGSIGRRAGMEGARRIARAAEVLDQAHRAGGVCRVARIRARHHQGHARLARNRPALRLRRAAADVDQIARAQQPGAVGEVPGRQHLLERVGGAVAVHAKGVGPGNEERLLQIGPAKSHLHVPMPCLPRFYAEFFPRTQAFFSASPGALIFRRPASVSAASSFRRAPVRARKIPIIFGAPMFLPGEFSEFPDRSG